MKAFLLAAGHGTRLRPLTDTTPKCLLPVRGTPMLQIWLDTCRRFQISDLLINVHAHAQQVRDFLRSHSNGTRVELVEERELLGSAGTLLANRKWIESESCFWIFYADVLHRVDLSRMLQLHRSKQPLATLGVYRVPDPSRCGIVKMTQDGSITEFVEKPLNPPSDLAFAGLMIATPAMLETVPRKKPVDIGFDVLPQLVGRMFAYPISDYLIDIGTLDNYRTAQLTWPSEREQ